MWQTDFPTPAQVRAFEGFMSGIITFLPRLFLLCGLTLAGITLLGITVSILLRYLQVRHTPRHDAVFLELIPPLNMGRGPEAMQKLYIALHGLTTNRSWLDARFKPRITFTFETVSTREGGMRFIAHTSQRWASRLRQAITAYAPAIQIRDTDDPLPANDAHATTLEFKQIGHFAYPLQLHTSMYKSDPLSYPMGAMTKLAPGELMAMQFVIVPTKVQQAAIIAQRLLHNDELLHNLGRRHSSLVRGLLQMTSSALLGVTKAVGEIHHGPSRASVSSYSRDAVRKQEVAAMLRPARTLSTFEQALAESVNDKVRQPLFYVAIRTLVITKDRATRAERLESMQSALGVFSIPGYQGLRAKSHILIRRRQAYRAFHARALTAGSSLGPTILSASELASLFHFPALANRAENASVALHKALPATAVTKRRADNSDFDVVLGKSIYQSEETNIGLTGIERQQHLYLLGATGTGKTTMMEYAIIQDIRAGRGAAMIDPHGDSAEKVLHYIPEDRKNDVIYFKPRDLDFPLGLNILEIPEGLTGSDLAHEKDRITEAVLSILQKVFDDNSDTNAYRVERVLRNAIHTAFTVENATIFTVLRILADSKYRKLVIKNLPDGSIKRFWKEELGRAGDFQRVKIAGPPISRIERYEISESARRILEQPKSTINFEDIINNRKILICNFALGQLGEDTSSLFGITVLAELQLASWRREAIAPEDRAPFYLYVDEFQRFVSKSFISFFTEARKYKLFVTMAQQSVSQLKDLSMLDTILDNVGTLVAFRSKSEATERILLHQLAPHIEPGEVGNLSSYNFYIKIAAEVPQEPMSGKTIVLPREEGSEEAARRVIDASRANYGTVYKGEASTDDKKGEEPPASPSPEGYIPRRH